MMATASPGVKAILQQLVELYVTYWTLEKLADFLKVSVKLLQRWSQIQKNSLLSLDMIILRISNKYGSVTRKFLM
jgi:hypothetical protein